MQSIKKSIVFGVIYLMSVSKIAYLIVYLGENVMPQFYWSHNLISFSFVIRDCKQWNKKMCIYNFQLRTEFPTWVNKPPSVRLCVRGVKAILECIHMSLSRKILKLWQQEHNQ